MPGQAREWEYPDQWWKENKATVWSYIPGPENRDGSGWMAGPSNLKHHSWNEIYPDLSSKWSTSPQSSATSWGTTVQMPFYGTYFKLKPKHHYSRLPIFPKKYWTRSISHWSRCLPNMLSDSSKTGLESSPLQKLIPLICFFLVCWLRKIVL